MAELGEKIVRSPEELSQIESLWNRYQRALEIEPSSFKFVPVSAESGLELDVRFFKVPKAEMEDAAFDHRITARVIRNETVALNEQEYEVQVDGRKVKSLGRYRYLVPEGMPISPSVQGKQLDGSYVVIDSRGNTIALVTAEGEIVPVGLPSIISERIREGKSIGYRCTCQDYSGQYQKLVPFSLGQVQSRYRPLGSIGACKHIYALRISRREPVAIPSDVPQSPPKTQRAKKLGTGVKGLTGVKWVP